MASIAHSGRGSGTCRCAGSVVRWETVRRPAALRYPPLRDGYIEKLIASYDWLERELDVVSPIHIGHIALATTLSWLEFRELPTSRKSAKTRGRFDAFGSRDSMRVTAMSGQTQDQGPPPAMTRATPVLGSREIGLSRQSRP